MGLRPASSATPPIPIGLMAARDAKSLKQPLRVCCDRLEPAPSLRAKPGIQGATYGARVLWIAPIAALLAMAVSSDRCKPPNGSSPPRED